MRSSESRRSPAWRRRRIALVAFDAGCWAGALVAATALRHEFDLARIDPGLVPALAVATAAVLGFGLALRVYGGRYNVGTVDDAILVGAATLLVGAVVFVVNLLPATTTVPRSVPLIATPVALVVAVGARLAVRLYRERHARPDRGACERVVVFGAGPDGQQLVRSMVSDPNSGYLPVALLDDDPDLRGRRHCGVTVCGTHDDVTTVAAATRADLLVVARRAADAGTVRGLAAAATEAGLGVKVLPPLSELLRPWVGHGDLRDLDIADLLGRRPVDIDLAAIAGYLGGRRVLVTGAGGSIGSELCRQIHRFGPAELLMLDRDESALHATQLSLYGSGLLDSPDIILADIRDTESVEAIFKERRPQVVFHAAALKHLPLLEQYPDEAWKSNVIGTRTVLHAARLVEVERFVNISTDKAANPVSVLGRSKRIGERFVAHVAGEADGVLLSVRFGNVLGSRGSVLSTFAEQIAAGIPITVTHPDVTRFFLTIPEAVQLAVYAAAIGRPGEALVLDMGSPVRIADVARQLMVMTGRSTPIVYTGLRPGEKLHEELLGDGEVDRRPIHPAVSHVEVPELDPAEADGYAVRLGAREAMVALTRAAVPGRVEGPDRWRQPA